MVMLDFVNEHFEVFGAEFSAHGVGHVGKDSISTGTGTREESPAYAPVLFNLVVHDPIAILLG